LTTDWERLDRASGGDEKAWGELVARHAPGLTRMAFLITGSEAEAGDLVQESFMDLVRREPGHRRGNLFAYLSTAVYHRALKHKKRAGRKRHLDAETLEDDKASPLDEVLAGERDRAIARVIRALDENHRDILVLRFYGGHSYKRIAEMTGIPLGTAKSRMFHAVKSCRNRLKEKGWLE